MVDRLEIIMRIKKHDDGYSIWLSANDTYNWANKSDRSWPCSVLADNRFFASVDKNGLCDFTLNGKMACVDDNELVACITDHLPDDLKRYWPCWKS